MTKEEIEQRAFEIANIVCGKDDTEAWHLTKKGAIWMAEWMQHLIHKLIENEEELDDMATYNNPYPNTMREGDNWEAYMNGFKSGWRKAIDFAIKYMTEMEGNI